MTIVFFVLVSVFFVLVLAYKFWLFSMKLYFLKKMKKNVPFECGFLPVFCSRMPFSLRFFFLLMIFVIFDVEMSLFLHLPFQIEKFFLKNRGLFIYFFLFLSFCFFEEWRRGGVWWVTKKKL